MFQFKNYLIPIFVGLLNISRAYGECTILKDSNGIYNANGCTANSYYLINSDASILKTAAADGIETILLNCENANGACSKVTVPGFYVNGAAANSYVECNSSNRCNIATVSNDACGENNVGKLTSNVSYGLCLEFPKYGGKKNYVNLGFANSDETYLVQHKQGTIFSFDKSVNYYCLKVTAKSITFDKECGNITDLVDQCTLYDEGKIIDRLTDFCSDKSSGKYYTCTYGKCISESQDPGNQKDNTEGTECIITNENGYSITPADCSPGYYLYSDEGNSAVCSYDGKNLECNLLNNMPIGYYWNDYKYSDVIKCTGSTCEKNTLGEACTNKAGEVIDNGYNLEFCTSTTDSTLLLKDTKFEFNGNSIFKEKKTLQVTEYSLIVNTDKIATCNSESLDYTNCGEGYYIYNINKLKSCKSSTKSCNDVPNPLGYFVNGENYIKCSFSGSNYQCNKLLITANTCSSEGILINVENEGVKLCLGSSNTNAISFGKKEQKYFLKANTFNSNLESDQYYIIEINTSSIQPVTLTPEDMYYKYTFDGSYEVLKDDSNACKNGKTSNDLVEYTKSNDNTYTKESIPESPESPASPGTP